jgi:hypothetical protein
VRRNGFCSWSGLEYLQRSPASRWEKTKREPSARGYKPEAIVRVNYSLILSSERTSHNKKPQIVKQETKIWSWARHQDRLADWLLVVLTSTSCSLTKPNLRSKYNGMVRVRIWSRKRSLVFQLSARRKEFHEYNFAWKSNWAWWINGVAPRVVGPCIFILFLSWHTWGVEFMCHDVCILNFLQPRMICRSIWHIQML